MSKILVKNGMIVDGKGKEPFYGHLLVENDRIAAVAHAESADAQGLLSSESDQAVDARGLAVSPGFIDCHSHFDWTLPLPNHQDILYPLIEQGVTTVITGNCGFSPAPVSPKSMKALQAYSEFLLEKPLDIQWKNMEGFLDHLDRSEGLLFNNVQLLGHGAVHIAALNDVVRQPDGEEMKRIMALTQEALDQGAFGFSLGLMYPPGLFSPTSDLEKLADIVAGKDRILTVHNRALSRYSGSYPIIPFFGKPHNLRALDEVLSIGIKTGVKIQISHFIFVGRKSWTTVHKALQMIAEAQDKGLRVMMDIYPHFCGNSYLTVFLPAWFTENLEENLENPKAVKRLKRELNMAKFLLGFDLKEIQIMEARYKAGEKYNGLNLVEIAAREQVEPLDAMLKIIKESGGKALQLTWGYSGDDQNEWLIEIMMRHPLCLFETDTLLISKGFPNPCSYGAFPRILGRFVREKKTLSLGKAVAKMSGKTADWFGIRNRGKIEPGCYADLVLFEPDTIADNTTVKNTAQRPGGIQKVMSNGQWVVENGRYVQGVKPGRVLRYSP
ncbi:MAG: amidohydrolase family protein [Deltaproteobacteria bacterium]|nr:amidohydrolase family protein [Deltaproteobacteria bacterium]